MVGNRVNDGKGNSIVLCFAILDFEASMCFKRKIPLEAPVIGNVGLEAGKKNLSDWFLVGPGNFSGLQSNIRIKI